MSMTPNVEFEARRSGAADAAELRFATRDAALRALRRAQRPTPLTYLRALALGLLFGCLARVVLFHGFGIPGTQAQSLGHLLLDAIFAAIILVILGPRLNLVRPGPVIAALMAVLALSASFHGFARLQPEMMGAMFSPQWVDEAQRSEPTEIEITLPALPRLP